MFRRWMSAALIAAVSFHAAAADNAEKVVRDTFKKISPNSHITSVTKSELPGFHQVLVDSAVYFVSDDGKYLISGKVFEIDSKQDLAEKQVAALRKTALAKIPA